MTTSPRRKHAAKMTVYLDESELLALDATVLEMRRRYGIKVDRGRYVREALAMSSLSRVADRLKNSGKD